MKKKTLISFILLLTAFGFIFLKPAAEQQAVSPPLNITDNEFMIGVTDVGWDFPFANIDSLKLNTWHKYTHAVHPDSPALGWLNGPISLDSNDRYGNPVNLYSVNVLTQIQRNTLHNMKTLMDRPKTDYLSAGQRSFYQCEPEENLDDHDYSFYTYNDHLTGTPERDETQFGSNQMVVHCRTLPADPPGYVVSGLKANREQGNNYWWYSQRDNSYPWYVMPKIRVNRDYVNDNANWDNPICRVDVIDWNGNNVPSFPNGIILYSKNFRRNNISQYSGDYINEFYFNYDQDPSAIKVPAGEICPQPRKGIWDWCLGTNDTARIKTDFRVYWYGQCDMWIDYICVENLPAYQLFDDPYFSDFWEQEIQQEVDLALTGYQQTGYLPNNFYREEFEFNMTPCIGEVNRIIQQYAATKGVDLSLIVILNRVSMKNQNRGIKPKKQHFLCINPFKIALYLGKPNY